MNVEREDGFTLVELLLSVAILVIIISALTGALITFLQNGSYASQRDDHSGGAVVLSTYLNRDLASADTVATSTAVCGGGSGTGVLTLSWTEWTATPANPSPAPTGGQWQASYVVTEDPQPAVGGATRYQLSRRLCSSVAAAQESVLVRNLDLTTAGSPASAVQVSTSASARCPEGVVSVTLTSYLDDTTGDSYRFLGCVEGRTG